MMVKSTPSNLYGLVDMGRSVTLLFRIVAFAWAGEDAELVFIVVCGTVGRVNGSLALYHDSHSQQFAWMKCTLKLPLRLLRTLSSIV